MPATTRWTTNPASSTLRIMHYNLQLGIAQPATVVQNQFWKVKPVFGFGINNSQIWLWAQPGDQCVNVLKQCMPITVRDVVSVSTFRSRDGLRPRWSRDAFSQRLGLGEMWERLCLGLKVKRLGLGPRLQVTFFSYIERKLNDIFALKFSSIVTQFPFKVLESSI